MIKTAITITMAKSTAFSRLIVHLTQPEWPSIKSIQLPSSAGRQLQEEKTANQQRNSRCNDVCVAIEENLWFTKELTGVDFIVVSDLKPSDRWHQLWRFFLPHPSILQLLRRLLLQLVPKFQTFNVDRSIDFKHVLGLLQYHCLIPKVK